MFLFVFIYLFSHIFLPLCQCGNMAREGLRTLVVAKKSLSEEQYQDFEVCTVHDVFFSPYDPALYCNESFVILVALLESL